MSKKKSFTGNTMTLKDFHGGSIPSDVPLPSAPGMVVRPIDRTGYDRQNAWGNPMGRSDHRLRPSSSGSMRNLDDKTPFLASIGHIGKNFEEDERKPLDGSSSPRRTVSDEGIRASSMRLEPKGEVGRFVGQQGLEQVVAAQGAVRARSYSGRVVDAGHLGVAVAVGSRPLSGNSGGSGSVPNAWGAKKEAVSASDVVSSSRTEQSTFSKFAQASALDQISSGRWQTKPLNRQVDVEVIKQSESPKSLYGRGHDSFSVVNFVGEKEYNGTALVRHVERGLAVGEGVRRSLKGMPGVDGVHSPVPLDVKEEMSVLYTKEGQPAHRDSKHRSLEVQMPSGMSERPKLKLLPRTKPLDAPEPAAVEYEQDFQWPAGASQPGNCGNIHGNASCGKPEPNNLEAGDLKPAVSSNEAGGRPVERPKLNLKPRSQPLDRLEGNAERERKAVFGGARPREMVLKLRGVDDVINSHEEVQNPRRIKSDVPRTEMEPVHANTAQHGEKIKNIPIDHGSGRSNGKREQRIDVQKSDAQKMNWRNENRRNSRDVENHPRQDRQPSPETWRKPVEQPGASDSNSSVRHCGKAVSAAELAQTFSRSASGSKSIDQFSGKRGIPAHTQVPFSRLAGPPTRPQINGY